MNIDAKTRLRGAGSAGIAPATPPKQPHCLAAYIGTMESQAEALVEIRQWAERIADRIAGPMPTGDAQSAEQPMPSGQVEQIAEIISRVGPTIAGIREELARVEKALG